MNTIKSVRFILSFVLAAALLGFVQCKQPSSEDTNAPPTITIGSHTNGQMVDGLITLAGTATDDAGLSKIEVSFDGGTTYTQAGGTASWQIDFDTTAQADGNLFIKAKATDSGGYTAFGFVTLIIDNAGPTVSIISPQDGQKLSGAFSIVGLGNKLDSVELSIDGGAYSAVTGNYTWYRIWDTTLETEGAHTISVRPVRGGVPGDAETVTVTVDQTVPSVTFTAPAIGAYIKGNHCAITGTATRQQRRRARRGQHQRRTELLARRRSQDKLVQGPGHDGASRRRARPLRQGHRRHGPVRTGQHPDHHRQQRPRPSPSRRTPRAAS